ncbi:MAG: AI-2E family transporter [Clostridia bacterium]|nr:AI-2E family transporter [Clostridia bacterium]
MLKRLYNKKYMSIALHSLLGLCVLILLAALVFRFPDIKAAVDSFLSTLRPLIFALVLSYFCNPLMNLSERYVFGWLDRFPRFPKKKRILSLLLSYLLILAVIASLVLITVPEVINNYESLINNLTEFVLIGVEWVDSILNLANIDSISKLIVDNSHRILEAAALFLTGAIVSLSGFTMTVILAGTLSFFMLLYREVWTAGLRRIALALMPRKLYAEINDTLIFANRTFGRYLLGSVFDSVLVGCETFLLMAIFGVPYAGLVSVVVGTTNIIPYFGPFIGAIPSFFIILTEDAFKAILFLVLVFVVQQIDGNIINPRIVGKTTSINSMWVILAITVIGGWLGIIGMVIAIPLFSVIYMLVSRFATNRLKKRGLPTDREAYAGVFSNAPQDDLSPQRAAAAEKPTSEDNEKDRKEDAE